MGRSARHGTYVSFDVAPAQVADAVRGLRALGFEGAHVTKPYKIDVAGMLDALTPSAAAVGAVNCIKRNGTALTGDNTDGKGFLASLRTITDPRGRHAVVFGAGGAARAIAVELAQAGAGRITVVNRTAEPAAQLVKILKRLAPLPCVSAALGEGYRLPPDAAIAVERDQRRHGGPRADAASRMVHSAGRHDRSRRRHCTRHPLPT